MPRQALPRGTDLLHGHRVVSGPADEPPAGPVRPSRARAAEGGAPWTPERRAAARPRSVAREVPGPEGGDALVRDATVEDAAACAALYAPYVLTTAATFETEPPDAAETARRIVASQHEHAWLVLVDGDEVVGEAHATPFRPRPAYRWTCETTVYLAPGATGRGLGRLLYGALLERLAGRGLLTATAVVALPNPASQALHATLGFAPVGTFARAGWKLGAWRDVAWYQRPLGEGPRVGVHPVEPS